MSDHVGVGELCLLGVGESCPGLLNELRSVGDGRCESAGQRAGRYNAPGEHAGQVLEASCRRLRRWHTLRRDCGGFGGWGWGALELTFAGGRGGSND